MFNTMIPVFRPHTNVQLTDSAQAEKLAKQMQEARLANAEHMLVPMTMKEIYQSFVSELK